MLDCGPQLTSKAVYFTTSCVFATKTLGDRNVHLTVKPPKWWLEKTFAARDEFSPETQMRVEFDIGLRERGVTGYGRYQIWHDEILKESEDVPTSDFYRMGLKRS